MPLFIPKQEKQPVYAGEDAPRNDKIPIWLPSARALVDTVTGLQFMFLAYPDGRLHPAQDVTHQQQLAMAMKNHRGYRL